MKRLVFLLLLLTFSVYYVKAGEPVPGAEVFAEQESDEHPIAFQQTGSSGTVTFDHLDAGRYRILVVLPKQKGKLLRGAEKSGKTDPVFDYKKSIYYLNSEKGFFSIKFDNLKKVKKSVVNPVYKVEKNRNGERTVIATFEISGKIGELTISIEALTSKQYFSKINKVKHDTAKATINNMR